MTDYTELVKFLRGLSPWAFPDASNKRMKDAAAAIEDLQAQLPKRGEWIRVNKSDESQRMELYIANHQIPDDESEKSRLIKYLFNIYIESERASQLGIFERSEHEVD